MARNKGGFVFASNFEVKLQGALDPRVAVDTKTDLISKETWPYDGDTIYLYKGLIVAVADTGTLFMLIDPANATAADYSGWKQLDAAAASSVDIINNLTSDRTDAALSAAQGKALMTEIDNIAGKLTAIYSYKGSVATYDALPADAAVGDVYNVEAAYNNYPAGTNYAYTSEGWDALGGSVDLSAYYTSEQVNAAIKVESDRAVAKENELAGLIATNTTNIASNKDDITTLSGTVSSLGEQITDINEEIAKKVDAVEGSSLVADDKIALIDTNAADIEALEGKITTLEGVDTGLDNRIKTLEGMISGGEIDGSSLVEVVGNHTTQIEALQTADTNINSEISKLKEADTNTASQISEIVTLNTQQTTQINDLNTKIGTLETTANNNTTQITNLATTVGEHTTAISALQSSVDGLAVKSVSADEKVLAADASGVLSTTLSLNYDSANKKIQLLGIDSAVVADLDATDFVKDGMISSVAYNSDTKVITITWNTDAGKEATEINMSNLVDTYTAGNGLELAEGAFSVKVDEASLDALTVSATGLKLTATDSLKSELGITAIDTRLTAVESALEWEEIE